MLRALPRRATVAAACVVSIALLVADPFGGTQASAATSPTPRQAKMADAFVDSMGINVHLGYGDTAYANFPMVKQRLVEAGLRHVRDYPTDQNVTKMQSLSTSGIKTNAVMGVAGPRPWFPASLDQLYSNVRGPLSGAVVTVEGANEWDLNGGPTWTSDLRAHQQKLYRLMKGDPATRHIPVLGPSMGAAYSDDSYDALGSLSPYLDYGSSHPYPGGIELSQERTTQQLLRESKLSGSKPLMITETGYHTSTVAADMLHPAVDPTNAGRYYPRLYLEAFRRGVLRTFPYQLLDERPRALRSEDNFGILKSDFTPKPAFTAISNLTSLLNDRGPRFDAGRIAMDIRGGNSRTRSVLLQKRNGRFWLALWQDERVVDIQRWRSNVFRPVNPPDVTIMLDFGARTAATTTYMPNRSRQPLGRRPAASVVKVSSSEEVTLVEIAVKGMLPPR